MATGKNINIGAVMTQMVDLFRRPPSSPEPLRAPAAVSIQGLGSEPYSPFGDANSVGGIMEWYYQWVASPADRVKEMQFYDRLEREVPEVEKALSAYATMATTGTLSGLNRGTYSIRVPDDAPQQLKDRMLRLQGIIRQHAFSLARGMTQYGSFPAWLRIGQLVEGGIGIVDIEALPPGTMFRNVRSNDPSQLDYWLQMINGRVEAKLSRWQTPHFALWTKPVNAMQTLVYGRSTLAAVGRVALQMLATGDSLIIGRLTRAVQKIAFSIDCSDLKNVDDRQTKVLARMKQWKDALSRNKSILSNGQHDSYEKPPVPDERFYLPGGSGFEGFKIDALPSDANITSVDDVKFGRECFAGAIGVPPQYIGMTGSQGGGRSNLSQVDINFARGARYIQLFLAAGFTHIVNVEMIAAGFDPRHYPCDVIPPTIGARDDLLQAQVRMLQSTVIKNLVDAGFDPMVDPKWVLMNLLNMDDELSALDEATIKKMFKEPPASTGALNKQATGKAAAEALLRVAGTEIEGYLDSIKMILAFADAGAAKADVAPETNQPTREQLMAAANLIRSIAA